MRKAILGYLAAALLAGTVAAGQQQVPATGQNKHDVPRHEPSKRNPDMKRKKRPDANVPKNTAPKHVNPGDVPHRQPGKKSPDLKQPAPGTVPGTNDR